MAIVCTGEVHIDDEETAYMFAEILPDPAKAPMVDAVGVVR